MPASPSPASPAPGAPLTEAQLGRQEIPVSQRLIMNFYTAKRLFSALGMTLQRHEGTFGPIELDIRKRAGSVGGGPPVGGVQPPR